MTPAERFARGGERLLEGKSDEVPALSVVLGELVALVRRYVVLTEPQAVAWALWVAHTHALEAAEQTPYLSITAPERRSGKTRLLEVSELVVARPWLTGRVSAAALVRKVDRVRPTLLLDESDAAFNSEKEYAEALRGILNTGHRANGKASLCVGQGAALDFRDFSTFCPKAIAGIGKLPDTVADRAIPIRLQRKSKDERVERFHERKAQTEAAPLRAHLESWAIAKNVETLRLAEPRLPEELSDRQQDGAEPLLAIADLAGGDWPKRSRQSLVELFGGDALEDESLGVRLLRDCRTTFEAHDVDRLSSSCLCMELVSLEEAPWSEFQKGKPLTVRGLARLLHPFGITSGSVRLDDGTTPKGYYRASFEDAWTRYLPPAAPRNATTPQCNAGAGFFDFSIRHTPESVADEKRQFVNTDESCGGVADKRPLPRPCGYHTGPTAEPCSRCGVPFSEHVRTNYFAAHGSRSGD
jgi:hypothetical protein